MLGGRLCAIAGRTCSSAKLVELNKSSKTWSRATMRALLSAGGSATALPAPAIAMPWQDRSPPCCRQEVGRKACDRPVPRGSIYLLPESNPKGKHLQSSAHAPLNMTLARFTECAGGHLRRGQWCIERLVSDIVPMTSQEHRCMLMLPRRLALVFSFACCSESQHASGYSNFHTR